MSSSRTAPPFIAASVGNLALLEHESLQRYGKYDRLLFDGRWYSNAEELLRAGKLARILRDRGVRQGDRVLAVLPNSPELGMCFQAAWTLGAVLSPLSPTCTSMEIAFVIRHCEAAVVITCPALSTRVWEACNLIGGPPCLCFGPPPTPLGGFTDIADQLLHVSPVDTPVDQATINPALLLYTSGTTAKPKGVLLTHGNVAAAIEAVSAVNPDLPRDVMLHTLPMTHIFGLLMLQLANRWGMQSVLLRQFDPLLVFQSIQQARVSYALMVPTMLSYLLHHPEAAKYDLNSLHRVITGGASLPEKLRTDFQERFGCHVEQGYGMSETGFVACYAEGEKYRLGSVGKPCPGFELKIVDDNDRKLGPGNAGELCLKGPSLTSSYLKDRAADQEAFNQGWFHTGDIGFVDDLGYLYITDRKKDLIIKGGENISPREIEEVLYSHPEVEEVAVVGIPDEKFGEEICAVVQRRAKSSIAEDELIAHAAARLSRFKVPSRVVFESALPRTPSGKINKRAIREQLKTRN